MERIAKFEKVSKAQFVADWLDTFGGEATLAEQVYEEIKLPKRATKGSAGYDFYSPLNFELKPGETFRTFPAYMTVCKKNIDMAAQRLSKQWTTKTKSAKLPVISLFAGAFFADSPWVGPLMYFAGLVIIFLCALLINAITGHKARKSFFIIELPEYKLPSLSRAAGSMLNRGWSYVVKAGTIILVCNFVVHVMQNFNWNFEVIAEGMEHTSILASIASPFAYVIAPVIGVVTWQLAAAAVTGFIAKENVVGTLAVCFAISNLFDLDELVMIEGSASQIVDAFGLTTVGALAYLMFNLFTPPCFAAIGAMNAELKSKKWLFAGIGLQLAVGFTVAFLVFFFGTLFTSGDFGAAWMPIVGWAVVLLFAVIITILIIRKNKQIEKEYALGK